MKCTIPEISWHNRDPVLSIDIQPTVNKNGENVDFYRLASGGTDSHVLIWHVTINELGSIHLDIAADLTRHQRAVNAVRWSPSGEFLASADDESVIFLWKLKSENETINILDNTNEQDKETWLTHKILRGHMEDVYDLCWSPNSLNLISGSVDNTAMVWDVVKGKPISILSDHKSFVQGVAWDPKNQYLATLSTDRYMRVFDVNTKKIVSRSSKSTLPVSENSPLSKKVIRLYHDDTLQTFYRRLCFSPDGELIIAPSGVAEVDEGAGSKPLHTTYIYTRASLKEPSIVLPSPDQYTIAVKCCPIFFELRDHTESNPPMISLPYRMIFALATKSSVYLYDTQQSMPFGLISNIHYTRLTDLTWSSDGKILIVSSTDGFCTLITFCENELGTVYVAADQKQTISLKEGTAGLDQINNKENNCDNKMETNGDKTDQTQKEVSAAANDKVSTGDGKPTPISFRKTPRVLEDTKKVENSKVDSTQIITIDLVSPIVEDTAALIDDKKPTPIAFRRTPRVPEGEINVNNVLNSVAENKTDEKKPTPIAFRKTPRVVHDETKKTNGSDLEPQTKPDEKKPTPIAFRKTPRVVQNGMATNDSKVKEAQTKADDRKATPIAFRRTQRIVSASEDASKNIDNVTSMDIKSQVQQSKPIVLSSEKLLDSKSPTIISAKTKQLSPQDKPISILLTSEASEKIPANNIISSEEKFQTPEKKNLPATPIQIRREPRNSAQKVLIPQSPKSDDVCTPPAKKLKSPKSSGRKNPKPIAVRRQPRTIFQTTVERTTITEEEAQDAWPEPIADAVTPKKVETKKSITQKETPHMHKNVQLDETADMRLVYSTDEDSQIDDSMVEEDGPAVVVEHVTPNSKTPRRVELRTISTPKSKKKLL